MGQPGTGRTFPLGTAGLLDHAGLMLDLAELVGRKVDLVSKNGLMPLIRDSVIQDAKPLYSVIDIASESLIFFAGMASEG
jgi:hypothetical protein